MNIYTILEYIKYIVDGDHDRNDLIYNRGKYLDNNVFSYNVFI